ncbi:MAG TPA: sensor histidine kinase [Segeticoccus sp.]|nr:sensor histidine kinase [Segeticoccus sp.]
MMGAAGTVTPGGGREATTAHIRTRLSHSGLFYRSDDEYTRVVGDFIMDGLDHDSPVSMAAPPEQIALVRDALGTDAAAVRFTDMTAVGRNPARVMPMIQAFVDDHAGQHCRFVGEPIWPGRERAEFQEATIHEALKNVVFAAADVDILCPYDAERLPPEVLADSMRTHPTLVSPAGTDPSRHYTSAQVLCSPARWPLPEPESGVETRTSADLRSIRQFVYTHALRGGLGPDRADDAALASVELCTNTLRHASQTPTVSVWRHGDTFVAQVQDSGTITDPLVGRRRVGPLAESGRGLFLVNELCDLVQIRSSRQAGTTVRIHLHGAG